MALSKNTIKWLRSLRLKKYRQKYNKFVVEGDKIALEILRQNRIAITAIYALDSWIQTNEIQLELHRSYINLISEADLKKVSALSTPNQVLIVAELPKTTELSFTKALYLDGIQDPGNLGTILRIADWFGLDAVFCSEDCADLYNQKVIQASMGAFLRVPASRLSSSELLINLAYRPLIGATLEGANLFQASLPQKGILVIGSEGKGISKEIAGILESEITIPKGHGGAESLNAGVACGIICAVWVNSGIAV